MGALVLVLRCNVILATPHILDKGRKHNQIEKNEIIQVHKLSGHSEKTPEDSFEGKYGLKVAGKWVSAEIDKATMTANRDKQDTWEAFTINWNVPKSSISIKTFHNTWVALGGKTGLTQVSGESPGAAGEFDVVSIPCNFDTLR